MRLADQWNGIETGLDPRWTDARLVLTVWDDADVRRASALLAPAGPGLSGRALHFTAVRHGGGVGPEAVRRMLRRMDEEQLRGTLSLVASEEAAPAAPVAAPSLAAAWDEALAVLPSDWSDALCELALTSSDHIDTGALLMAPLNPLQHTGGAGPAFRFRASRTFGYGASAGMVRRCLARLDETGIPGDLRVLRALSDTHPVGTQGPVWYVDGRAV